MSKKIVAGIVTLAFTHALYAAGGAAAAHFSAPKGKEATHVGGMVGKSVIFLYKNNPAADVTEPKTLDMMALVTKKQICEGKDTRMLVEDLGMQVVFVYPNQKDGSVTVLTVDSCEGIKKKK